MCKVKRSLSPKLLKIIFAFKDEQNYNLYVSYHLLHLISGVGPVDIRTGSNLCLEQICGKWSLVKPILFIHILSIYFLFKLK